MGDTVPGDTALGDIAWQDQVQETVRDQVRDKVLDQVLGDTVFLVDTAVDTVVVLREGTVVEDTVLVVVLGRVLTLLVLYSVAGFSELRYFLAFSVVHGNTGKYQRIST